MPTVDEAIEIKRRVEKQFLSKQGVTGVDVGYKYVDGERTEQVAIRVHVSKKSDEVSDEELIPAEIDGATTDVLERTYTSLVEAGVADLETASLPVPNIGQYRPVLGGISIGPAKPKPNGIYEVGTLGTVLWDNVNSKPAALTCFHVACMNNNWHVGDPQTQPSIRDLGTFDADEIGWIDRATLSNVVDGAVVPLVGVDGPLANILDIGQVSAPIPASLGMQVRKQGRTSRLTYGYVDGVDASVAIAADPDTGLPEHFHQHQITIRNDGSHNFWMVLPGDSGSSAVDDQNHLIGMLFASDGAGGAIANPMGEVLQELDLSMAPLEMRATIVPATLPIGQVTHFEINVIDIATGKPIPNVNVTIHNYTAPKDWKQGGDLYLTYLPAQNAPFISQATFYMGREVIDPRHHIVVYDLPPFFSVYAHGYRPVVIQPIFDSPYSSTTGRSIMGNLKILVDDGTELSAQADSIPREGDRLILSDSVGGQEKSYTVTGVDFQLQGPMTYMLDSVTVRVTKSP